MTVEDNKAVVRSFFEEALDKGNMGLVDNIFTEDCVFHRGDLTEPAPGIYQGYVRLSKGVFNFTATSERQFIR